MIAVFSSTNRRMGSRSSVNSLKTSHEIKISVIVVTNLRYIHRSQIRTPYDRLMANEQPCLARSIFFGNPIYSGNPSFAGNPNLW